ncbi:cupin domain-containing protein [Sphingopyxis sp.]|uniref:cupin domain-containing protein n=1 Tax=Sphingopyxis sp. TaxID=1908224 RepID=UPI0025FE8489|nr:cupin domain-containing protein [Sphingopyxis sp.]MBK6414073.1 hypothetical protein [Sphingopyxis sp.]
MSTILESDPENGRVWSMWEQCGIQFRSNLVESGGCIPLHIHSYDHVAMVTHGVFECTTIAPDGVTEQYIVSSKDFDAPESRGYRIVVPAGYQHTFVLLESRDQPGEVLCFWPNGGDQ